VLDRVYFETNSAKLKPESSATLDKVAASLKGVPGREDPRRGHTDSVGSDAYNLKLSAARANSVLEYLVSQGRAAHAARGRRLRREGADRRQQDGRGTAPRTAAWACAASSKDQCQAPLRSGEPVLTPSRRRMSQGIPRLHLAAAT
jgi:flagellar motor protein MotB